MLAILGWMGMAVSAFLFVDMDDALLGSLGNDVLVGGAGADMMHGGSGNDILYDQGN
ncbi:MAG: Ca2+-binding RTX toxin-like protein, partial [Yoonia sp.]